MGIIQKVGSGEWADKRLTPEEVKKATVSAYTPTEEEKEVRAMIIRHFTLGYQTMYKPRREFNDMSVIGRMMVDQMSFNTYQPNNGDSPEGDLINGWRSNAIRPIVRNKCISVAAHATARLIFPKIFAFNDQSDTQEAAARVMEDLMEWSAEQSKYSESSLNAIMSALFNPASITYTEYGEVFRTVKRDKDDNGKWVAKKELDDDLSGFKDQPVPVDELYIENFYENDLQKQGWIIWRRVIGYDLASVKFSEYTNWKYVKPGVQVIFNDVNTTFYESYDTNMRNDSVEEVYYWNKKLDVKLCMVNGILLTEFDNPNPREDKLYPFIKFGYELVDEGKCFYYKSLAFKLQQDANIINTLYPMIIDGTYLSVFPPMVNIGSETIGSDVIIPGGVTTLADPNSKLSRIELATNLRDGMNTLMEVEKSVNDSSQEPIMEGQQGQRATTAYEISRLEQNANTVLGLFIKMIAQYVRQYGRLRIGDIIQHLTIVDVDKITDNTELVYKSFLVNGKGKSGKKKIEFTDSIPEESTEKLDMENSYKLLKREKKSEMEIYQANPTLFRELKYQLIISPDVLHPKSEDLERAMKLELYDRAILNPLSDQESIFKDFLLGAYKDVKKPEDYISKQQAQPQQMTGQAVQPSPLASMSKIGLPQQPAMGKL
jgi:hypothetical protein